MIIKSFVMRIIFCFVLVILLINLVIAEQRAHIVLSNDHSFVFMENTGTGNYNAKHVIKTTIQLPHEISAGDFDNDKIWDATINHWQDGKFSVFWGSKENDEITFIEQVFDISQVPRKSGCLDLGLCPGQMHAIGIGDFNEDGFADLVLVDNENNALRSVVIAFSDGKRGWSKFDGYEMPNNRNARRVKVDDFNNDNHLDFIVPEALGDSFYIFLGNGKGNFDIIENTKGFRLHEIESGDIDNDGDKDLIVTDFYNILLLKNDGNGEFTNFKSFCVRGKDKQCIAGDFLSVEAVDLNKDGFLDIVAIKRNGIYVWKGENEEFKPLQYIKWSFDRVFDMEKADVDNDGNIDIISGVFNSGADAFTGISVFKGKGDGTFFTPGKIFLAEKVNTGGGSDQVMIDVYYEDVEEQEGPKFLRGDSDSNGNLELTDAIRILKYLFQGGETPKCLDAADVDDNGFVVISDAIRILKFLFQGGEAPAVPYPNYGVDPSADDLGCEG